MAINKWQAPVNHFEFTVPWGYEADVIYATGQ